MYSHVKNTKTNTELEGFTIEDCIDSAYTEISTRRGKMHNGTFVKETL